MFPGDSSSGPVSFTTTTKLETTMSHLNITDAKGRWRVTSGQVENRETNEVRRVTGISESDLQRDHEEVFARKCKQAFATGEWPR